MEEELKGQIAALAISVESIIKSFPQDQRIKVAQNMRTAIAPSGSAGFKKAYSDMYRKMVQAT